jgi:hypothetical protein
VFVDSYGTVVDQYGRALPDAWVTLLRSDTPDGPFAYVPDGDEEVMPGQAANPQPTTVDGWYWWTPADGWYVVEASAPGCTTAATPPLEVAPPNLYVTVRLVCDAPAPTATPLLVTGPDGTRARPRAAAVGATLTAEGGVVGAATVVQWLRGGQVVGAGSAYVVQAADAGQELRARAVSVRPDAVPEPGRGEPVSFLPVRTTSEAVAVAADPDGPTPPGPGPGTDDDPGGTDGTDGSGATPGVVEALARTGIHVLVLVGLGALLLVLGSVLVRRTRPIHPNG